jgi:transposase
MMRLPRAARRSCSGGRRGMEKLVERVAGLDVHKSSVAACVRTPGDDDERRSEIRTFGTTTKELLMLRDWLKAR